MAIARRTVLTGLAVFAAAGCTAGQPAPAPPAPFDLGDLEVGGRLGVHAVRVGRSLSWRGRERFTYCSTFKLFLAAATLMRVQAGEEQLDRRIMIRANDLVAHAPVTGLAVGDSMTIQALCEATVELSDNPAANILIGELGGLDAWRTWYRSLDDTVTRVDRLEPHLNGIEDARDTTTPAQFTANLQALFGAGAGRLMPALHDLLVQWLVETPTGIDRIKAGVPAGWRVAHKTGTSSQGPVNDIGVVFPPTGDPIFISAFWQGPESDDFSTGEAAIAEATRRVIEILS